MNIILNKAEPTALEDVKLDGYVGEMLGRFAEWRITSDFAKNVVYREAADAFVNQFDDKGPLLLWQGEFWGKWMIGAARMCRYLKDEELKAFIKTETYRFLELQDENGYIGTYKNSINVMGSNPDETEKIVGWRCDWNWNIWCRKYTLWGLLECYQLLNDDFILDCAARFADHLIKELHDNNIKIWETGVFEGMPSCSILKPLVLLYRNTGKQEYLNFALEIAQSWEETRDRKPAFFINAALEKAVHEWYSNPEKWAKAYEMLSCLEGLLELYRVTGTEKYFACVSIIYDLLYSFEKNQVTSVGFNDKFAFGGNKLNAISEPCDIIHWCALSYEMFKLTSESRYMDIFEETFYNAFLASVSYDGRWGARGIRSSHANLYGSQQAGLQYNHCCVNNMPRCFMDMAQASVMKNGRKIYINFFTKLSAVVRLDNQEVISIKIGGSYLTDGKVSIEAECGALEKEVELYIRIPKWSGKTIVQNQIIEPCGYYILKISNSVKVDVCFDLNPRIEDFRYPVYKHSESDWQCADWVVIWCRDGRNLLKPENMFTSPMSIIHAGPILLARSKRIGSTENQMFSGETVWGKNLKVNLKPVDNKGLQCCFDVSITLGDGVLKTTMCDYASSGNEYKTDPFYFNMYV